MNQTCTCFEPLWSGSLSITILVWSVSDVQRSKGLAESSVSKIDSTDSERIQLKCAMCIHSFAVNAEFRAIHYLITFYFAEQIQLNIRYIIRVKTLNLKVFNATKQPKKYFMTLQIRLWNGWNSTFISFNFGTVFGIRS